MGTQTQTQKTTIPGASGEEAGLRATLAALAQRTSGEMGDLSGLAAGNIAPSESDRAFLETVNSAAMEIARRQAERNYVDSRRDVESGLRKRGMDDTSIEAVSQAILGRQRQASLDDIALQGSQRVAEGMVSLPFQRAGVTMSANQLLLEKLIGAANPVLQAGLQERLAQTSTTSKTKGGGVGQALQLGMQAAQLYSGLRTPAGG